MIKGPLFITCDTYPYDGNKREILTGCVIIMEYNFEV